ncbi:MAG: helix-turn-helix transcriptional regulator, partial [Firmicutes bacterium]|nr:helix-turn-helix transcriptional regulator [Bacillota bacterium]
MDIKNVRSDRAKGEISTVRKDGFSTAKMYNMDMTYDAETLKQYFATRLTEMRMKRNVSAREMSISLGRGAGYINSIESGHVLPSMVMLFEICDYLNVSPK